MSRETNQYKKWLNTWSGERSVTPENGSSTEGELLLLRSKLPPAAAAAENVVAVLLVLADEEGVVALPIRPSIRDRRLDLNARLRNEKKHFGKRE